MVILSRNVVNVSGAGGPVPPFFAQIEIKSPLRPQSLLVEKYTMKVGPLTFQNRTTSLLSIADELWCYVPRCVLYFFRDVVKRGCKGAIVHTTSWNITLIQI